LVALEESRFLANEERRLTPWIETDWRPANYLRLRASWSGKSRNAGQTLKKGATIVRTHITLKGRRPGIQEQAELPSAVHHSGRIFREGREGWLRGALLSARDGPPRSEKIPHPPYLFRR